MFLNLIFIFCIWIFLISSCVRLLWLSSEWQDRFIQFYCLSIPLINLLLLQQSFLSQTRINSNPSTLISPSLMLKLFNHFIMDSYNRKKQIPKHWLLFSVAQPIVLKFYHILAKGMQLLQPINEAITIHESYQQNLTKMKWAALKKDDFSDKQNRIKQMMGQLLIDFKNALNSQRFVTQMFIDVMKKQTEENLKYVNAINQDEDLNLEYKLYIKNQYSHSLGQLHQFISHQLQFADQCSRIITFYRPLPSVQNEQVHPQESIINIHIQEELQNYGEGALKDKLAGFKKDQIFQSIQIQHDQPFRVSKQIQILQVFMPLIVLALPVLVYLLIYFPNYNYLSQNQFAWEAPAFCLFYYWINYFLTQYCYKKSMNVIVGMSSRSSSQLPLLKNPHYLTAFLLMTLAYLILLILYLNWWTNNTIQIITNSIFIIYFFVEVFITAKTVSIFKMIETKLSYLHFATMILPISDVLTNVSGASKESDTKLLIIKAVDLLVIVLICGIQVLKKYKSTNIIASQFIGLVIIVVGAHISGFFVQHPVVIFFEVSSKLIIVIFMVLFRYPLFASQAFYSNLKLFFQSFWGQDQHKKVLFDILSRASYPKVIKIFFMALIIFYLLLSSFIVEVQESHTSHKYLIQTILMACYILSNIYYINEAVIHLRHPFSNFTYPFESPALVNSPRGHLNFNFVNLRIQENLFDPAKLLKRAQELEKLNKKADLISENGEELEALQEQLDQQFGFKLFS